MFQSPCWFGTLVAETDILAVYHTTASLLSNDFWWKLVLSVSNSSFEYSFMSPSLKESGHQLNDKLQSLTIKLSHQFQISCFRVPLTGLLGTCPSWREEGRMLPCSIWEDVPYLSRTSLLTSWYVICSTYSTLRTNVCCRYSFLTSFKKTSSLLAVSWDFLEDSFFPSTCSLVVW